MTTAITIRNLGHHGPKSRAPQELRSFLKELFEALFGQSVIFDVIVENRRLEPQGNEIIRGLRIERGALVLRCRPSNDSGRICHIHFQKKGLADTALAKLIELVDGQGLDRNNYQMFLKNGKLHEPLDEFWTKERLDQLTGALLVHNIPGRGKATNQSFDLALARIVGESATNYAALDKHIRYLEKNRWIRVRPFGKNRRISTIHPGKEMARHFAVCVGAIDPEDTSEEALNRYFENNEIVNGEFSRAISKLRSAKADLPKAEKQVERLTDELLSAESRLAEIRDTIAAAERDMQAVHDLRVEVNPLLAIVYKEAGIELPIPA